MPLSDEPGDVFKVWPTNADRAGFCEVMRAGSVDAVRKLPRSDPNDEWLIPNAYIYLHFLKSGRGPRGVKLVLQ